MRSIKSLEKGLEILEIIAAGPEGVRMRDISSAMEDPVSNLKLYLDSLMNAGYVRRDPQEGVYYLSRKVSDIANLGEKNQHALLKKIALPEMRKLKDDFDENVLLGVVDGLSLHFLVRLQSERSVQIRESVELDAAPHVTAAGKAIIAFFDEETREKYINNASYHRYTEKSLVTPSRVRDELESIRNTGYAVNYGEYETEIMAVGSPILSDGKVLASVTVQFPSFRYEESDLSTFGTRIVEAARVIGNMYSGSLDPVPA